MNKEDKIKAFMAALEYLEYDSERVRKLSKPYDTQEAFLWHIDRYYQPNKDGLQLQRLVQKHEFVKMTFNESNGTWDLHLSWATPKPNDKRIALCYEDDAIGLTSEQVIDFLRGEYNPTL